MITASPGDIGNEARSYVVYPSLQLHRDGLDSPSPPIMFAVLLTAAVIEYEGGRYTHVADPSKDAGKAQHIKLDFAMPL